MGEHHYGATIEFADGSAATLDPNRETFPGHMLAAASVAYAARIQS